MRSLDRLITGLESGATYRTLTPWVRAGMLAGAGQPQDAAVPLPPGSRLLGEVFLTEGIPGFRFSRLAFAREYQIDEPALADWHARHGLTGEQRRLLYKLHLINSRNRLNWGLLQAVLEVQAAYFRAGDPLALLPLPQAHMVARMKAGGDAARAAQPDAGRLSRLIRGANFRAPDGRLWPLSRLFPKPRQLHGHQLKQLIEQEKALFRDARIERALSDELLAQQMQQRFGSRLSRRSVAQLRQQLGIPDGRRRGEIKYHALASEAFSALFPMTPQGISHFIPAYSGVYEIRCAQPSDAGARSGVVYIGSSQDLKKRLYEHLSGNSGNVHLSNFLAGGGAKVRFWVVQENWRQAERQLYLAFCESFGVPPPCNRMSP